MMKINWLIVTLIAAILALSIALFHYYFPPFDSEVEILVNAIRSAQAEAYTSGLKIEFSVANDGKSYSINCNSAVCASTINGKENLSFFTTIKGENIFFQSNGQPLNKDGKLYLDPIVYVLSRKDSEARVSVSGLTGWVKVLD